MEPRRRMDRLHPPLQPPVVALGSSKPDGSSEKSLTTGPGDEGPSWAASSRELIFQRSEATGGTAFTGYRSTAANRARSSSPGRIRPRLVWGDGHAMRRALLLAVAIALARPRRGAKAHCRSSSRSGDRSPPLPSSPASTPCAPTSSPVPARTPSISEVTARYWERRRRRRSRRRRCGCASIPKWWSGSKVMRNFERHPRSRAGDRRAPGGGSARLSGSAGRAGGAAQRDELGQGAPGPPRAVTVLVR